MCDNDVSVATELDQARDLALEAVNRFGGGGVFSDVVKIASAMGIEVYVADLPDDASGVMYKNAEESIQMLLRRDDSFDEQCIICALLLGRYVADFGLQTDVHEFGFSICREASRRLIEAHQGTEKEMFAKAFALKLLVPNADLAADGYPLTRQQLNAAACLGPIGPTKVPNPMAR